jgi:Flp pilus assembly protein TadB
VSKRRKERERRHRIAHAEVVKRDEREPRPERAPSRRAQANTTGSRRKPVPAPSLQRSVKRAAMVFVVLTAVIYLVDKGKHSIGADAAQALIGSALFVPFDFLLTKIMYRRLGPRINP